MTPYNMALASFLFASLRVVDYFSNKFYGYQTSGWMKKKEMDRTGEAVAGYSVMLGYINKIRTKGSFGL